MADQHTGTMICDLENAVGKTLKRQDCQPGVGFSLEMMTHFDIACWLPLVIMGEAARAARNGSRASGIHVEI